MVDMRVAWLVYARTYCVSHEGEETRSGSEKRCSHNLQGDHLAWWSADNCGIFPKVNISEARKKIRRGNNSIIEKII